MYDNYKTYVSSRILARSIKRDNGCIEYQGNWGHKYGLISITVDGKRKGVPAHRAMYMAVNDKFDLPTAIKIRHKCDNQRCVNIEHLVEGTAKDNMRDCIERNRRAKKYKPHIRQRKLTNEQINDIRSTTGKCKLIAEKFGISVGYVSKIKNLKAKTFL